MKKVNVILISCAIVMVCSLGIMLIIRKINFKQSLVRIARTELRKWNGLKETSKKASQILIGYWKSVGLKFSASQMQSASVHSTYPWSSAFISWLFFKAGAEELFPYSQSHSGYFQVAKKNRNNPNASLRGFRITEYAPKVGDLIVYSRTHGKGYDSTGFFASHGELVIEVGNGFVKSASGNVSNTAKESIYKTDSRGFLKGNRVSFFMVIQNNIKWRSLTVKQH